jgi:hypothetical protein
MATQTAAQREQEATRVTVPEIVTGPVAGALVGYGVFAIALVVIGALFAEERLSLPEQSWKDLGLGASVLAGVILFFGYLYGGFIAGRVGGAGQRGIPLGVGVFLAGLALAALAGAVSSGTSGDERETAAQTLRALGAPGGSDDWADIGTTAGVSSVAGMLLGSMAGGALAEHRTRAAATRGGSKRRKK